MIGWIDSPSPLLLEGVMTSDWSSPSLFASLSLLRQNSLRELFYGLCSQKQRNPKSVFPGLATKSRRKKPGFVMVYLISAGN